MTQIAGPLAGTRPGEPQSPPTVPFSVVDELSCYHDHRSEPNTVHLELELTGHLDPVALRAAVAAMLASSPRARARRAARGRLARSYRWEFPPAPDHDPVAVTSWRDDAELASLRAEFLASAPDLDRSPAFLLLLAAGPGHDVLMLSAHHAALDGQSCLQLISGICDNYPRPPGPPLPKPAPPQPDRHSIALAGHHQSAGRPGRPRLPRLAGRLTVTRIAADHAGPTTPARDGYGCLLLPVVDVSSLQLARSRHDATVNDLLICALVRAIASWNTEHHKHSGRTRITMPVSARPPAAAAELGNLSRLAVVRAGHPGAADFGAACELARTVAAQTRQAKDFTAREVDPVSRALTTALLPVAVKRALLRGLLRTAGPAVIDTSLLSNLGVIAEPPRFASVTTAAMAFSTSAHLPRGLSAGAITVGGQLQVCLRYRRALLSDQAADRFAGYFCQALAEMSRC